MKKIIYSSIFLSILQSILFWEKSPGISVTIFLICTILVIFNILKEKEMIKNQKGKLVSIPIILLGLTYFIFDNELFKALNIPVIFTLIIIMCIKMTEGQILENKFIKTIIRKVFKPFYIIFEFIGDFEIGEFIEKNKEDRNKKMEKIKKIGKSILISIPVIIIIILLLSSADSIFGSIFKDVSKLISKIFESDILSNAIARTVLIIIAFAYIAGFIITFVQKEKDEESEKPRKNISLYTINTLLISLDIIYFVFSIIQFKYLFLNAGKTANFDYATYARTGFFQLMFVSFINFALIKMSKNTQSQKMTKTLKILMIVFTAIIIISAMFRMHLYEQEYGYTYLRIFVDFILATEILVLIPVLFEIYGKSINTFEISLKIIITMYLILNFINIDYIIASNNINIYLEDPENNRLDTYYIISKVGIDAIDKQLELLNYDMPELSYERTLYWNHIQQAFEANIEGYKSIYKNYKFKWQEWNMSKMRMMSRLSKEAGPFDKKGAKNENYGE